MFKTILIGVFLLLAGVLILAALQPGSFRVQRATDIAASPEKIFSEIDDFHRWVAWSPWEKVDPAMKRHYSGAPKGNGAIYEWEGNHNVGQGRMEILQSSPFSTIIIKLDFVKPLEGHNRAEFILEPQANVIRIAWSMSGEMGYLGKVMHLFFNMDDMVGKQFEAGLANLKSIAELPAART